MLAGSATTQDLTRTYDFLKSQLKPHLPLASAPPTLGPHDWTHPAEYCDEPGCNHITRRTCEGAAKVEKFLRETLQKRTELLRKADPLWAKQADANIARAIQRLESK